MVHTFAWVDKVLVMEINAKWVQSIKFEDENSLKRQRAVASKAQMPSFFPQRCACHWSNYSWALQGML
jgi:hypothetical protein